MIYLMEHQDDERQIHAHHHIARKLNFNAPLLTTRRPPANVGLDRLSISTAARISSSTTSDRVPFCWEQVPGKPKEYVERCHGSAHESDVTTPRPTLPPGWWRPPIQTRRNSRHLHCNDHGCEDNVDGNNDNDDNSSGSGYVLSDAMDVLSLSEAIDIVEKAEKAHKFSNELKLKELKLYEEEEEEERNNNSNYNHSSNFMIERFLPDATALAASSVLNRHAFSPQRVSKRPFSPPKGCGLDVLFPWRIKHHHQLCGVKSPVRDGGRSLGSKSSAKQKKHH
ncbi:uncharacterized protein LOC120074256 [Benincasa hispida]|uniref:uncharacterized protein LOC120074256 n=1 Tax=Benincasa hispida TaxID=102211 RepID=UPI001901D466|nr:uncharacterized protein LOC120074256 [Benincasa hispida]